LGLTTMPSLSSRPLEVAFWVLLLRFLVDFTVFAGIINKEIAWFMLKETPGL